MREQLRIRYQLHASIITALETKCEHSSGTLWCVFLVKRVMLVAWQASIVHPGNLVVLGQPTRNLYRIVAMFAHAKGQRFHARQDQEGIERRDCGSKVTQTQNAAGNGKGNATKGLVQLEP